MTQEILDDITSYMERRFQVGEPTATYMSVAGEPYMVLSCGGKLEEGSEHRVLTTDLLKAAELFLYEFERNVKDKSSLTHTLYWRRKPEVFTRTHVEEATAWRPHPQTVTYYGITARFVVSDKPPLSEAELNRLLEARRGGA